ncbi:AMP-binding protein, partial [bacterium]|nr:AMP-binding protein [bacterium]
MLAHIPRVSDRLWVAHYPKDVPTHLEYPSEPAYWLLEEAAGRFPTRDACSYYRQVLTYGQLLDHSRRMATALRARGLQPGDRVGILLPNAPEYLIALFGTWIAGGVAVPLNPLMVPEEVAVLLRTTACRAVVCLDLLLPLLGSEKDGRPDVLFVTSLADRLPGLAALTYLFARLRRLGLRSWRRPSGTTGLNEALAAAVADHDLPRPRPEEPALIVPTGGTTGWPKAVLLTHRNLLANALQIYHWWGRPTDRSAFLAVLPFCHIYGLTACALTGVAMSATLLLHHRFRADQILTLVERRRPTHFPAVPAMLVAFNKVLRRRRYDLSSIRTVISG